MRYKKRVLLRANDMVLSRCSRKDTGRVYYELKFDYANSISWDPDRFDRIRDIIDPVRNRSGHFGTSWKYPNREAAEKDLVMLSLLIG